MANQFVFCVLLSLCLVSLLRGVDSSLSTTPVIMWSNTHVFNGQNTQANNFVSAQEVSSAINHESSSVSKYFNKNADKSEIIVIFVEPSLSTEQIPLLANSFKSHSNGGALSNIKNFVESSESSLTFPYVSSRTVANDIIQSLSNSVEGSTYVIDGVSMTPADLVEKINGKWEVLNNGVTDIIIVRFNSPAVLSMADDSAVQSDYAADDSVLSQIISSLDKKSVKYTAIFTANHVSNPNDIIHSYTRSNGAELRAFAINYGQNHNILYTTFWPIGVVEAIFVMAPFIGILFIGVCCTFNIQSALKFDAEKIILRKH